MSLFSDPALLSRLVTVEFAAAGLVFPLLFLVPAPYGRHRRPGWGPEIDARLGWFVMELPAVVVPALAFGAAGGARGPGAILLGLWLAHYLNRALIFPWRLRSRNSRSPLVTVLLALLFNVLNGTIIGWSLAVAPPDPGRIAFWSGILLFVAGLLVNLQADAILRSLRAPGGEGYRIPQGGAFRWVSCANYFGEIVEWAGFAVAAMTPAAWAFAVFTAANLIPRAWAHHRWYRRAFPDYPSERRAVLPYLF